MILNMIAIIKNGIIEIEGQKVHKQAGDQRNGAKAYQKNKINPKAFTIPILTASGFYWLM